MKNKIITLLGGSGTIGRNLVNSLIKKNFRVIITTRNSYQNTYLKTQSTPGALELIDWDAKNFDKIEEAIKNSDIVINLIGILYETRKQKFDQIHAGIPQAISKLCAKANVDKFITVSAIGSSPNSKSAYQRSKFKGEQNALNNFDRTIILRPSVIESSTSNFSRLFARLSFLPVFASDDLNGAMYQASLSPVIIKLTCVAANPVIFPVPTASVSPFSPNTIGYDGSKRIVSPDRTSTSKIRVVAPVVTPA